MLVVNLGAKVLKKLLLHCVWAIFSTKNLLNSVLPLSIIPADCAMGGLHNALSGMNWAFVVGAKMRLWKT